MKSLKNECHDLAEHIMRLPAKSDRMRWLKGEMAQVLLGDDNIRELTWDYEESIMVKNPYLAELTNNYEGSLK